MTSNLNKILRDEVCDAIYTVIPEVPRLVELFHNWICLDQDGKERVDREVQAWNSTDRIELYSALRDAFNKWDYIQDTEGAPGCDSNSFNFSYNPHLEEELMSMLINLELVVSNNHRSKDSQKMYQVAAEKPLVSSRWPPLCPRAPHTIRSCLFTNEAKKTRSLEKVSGYQTD